MSIEGEILIRRPVDEVFDYVADQRNEPRFNPRMSNVLKLTDGPIGAGTRFRATTTSGGRALDMTIEFTVYERPHVLGSRSTMAAADTVGALTFRAEAEGTRMRWSWQVHPTGAPRFLGPLIDLIGRRQERTIWRSLKRELEDGPTDLAHRRTDEH